jgi:hypothetical protein
MLIVEECAYRRGSASDDFPHENVLVEERDATALIAQPAAPGARLSG